MENKTQNTFQTIASLNEINPLTNRLIQIARDGKITDDTRISFPAASFSFHIISFYTGKHKRLFRISNISVHRCVKTLHDEGYADGFQDGFNNGFIMKHL